MPGELSDGPDVNPGHRQPGTKGVPEIVPTKPLDLLILHCGGKPLPWIVQWFALHGHKHSVRFIDSGARRGT